jgi:NitT/TauT family transport system permease protein
MQHTVKPPSPPKSSISPNVIPMLVVAIVAMVLYPAVAFWANLGPAERLLQSGAELGCTTAAECAFQLRNPVVPGPNQLLQGIINLMWPPTSPTSVPYNAFFTGLETLVGLLFASILGIGLAVLLVLSKAFEKAMLPWLIASQTVPIIAIAPMLAVLLGRYGVSGWLPKAIIATYIAFFPVAIGVAKGLNSPDPLTLDLMKTYNASASQTFWLLRLPASIPYLFTALKVAAAAALIGSIVAESATVSFVGLGAMLAQNARASDIVATWVMMIGSSILGMLIVTVIHWIEHWLTPWRAGR